MFSLNVTLAADEGSPLVHFAATGPADHTYGPRCSTGIGVTESGYFRITASDEWVFRGSGGGSGADHINFNLGKTRIQVDVYGNASEFSIEKDFEDLGETGVVADLAGSLLPVHKVALKGREGFGILGFTWMEAPPPRNNHEGTVLITSNGAAGLTAEKSAEVLGSVRVERCAVVQEMLIPYDRKLQVPEFAGGDPLGKTRPDQEAPEYVPGKWPLAAYSEEQVAYLLPLDAELSECVSPLVRADGADSPLLHMQVLTPTGTHKEVLAGYVEKCE
jgi:hypothetical protein